MRRISARTGVRCRYRFIARPSRPFGVFGLGYRLSMRTLLLSVHIVSVAAWLGGNFTQMFLMRGFSAGDSATAAAWFRGSARMAKIYYSIAGVLLVATGIGLVLNNDAWSFGSGFVTVGFVAVIIGAVTGVTFFGPRAERAIEEFESGRITEGRTSARSIGTVAMVDTVIVLIALVAMVSHWQA